MVIPFLTKLTGVEVRYWVPALAAVLLGSALVLAVGFAPMQPVHNATHDTRHAAAFPCH